MSHHCHALFCEVKVPPRMHMCRPHWAMVPAALQRRLWAAYRPGQERDMQPSPAYLRAAAACVSAVANAEGHPQAAIATEVGMYEAWAGMVADGAPEPPETLPRTLDGIGRFIAQALADAGLDVSTYGVCADLIHVTTPDGRLYDVCLDEPSEKGDVVAAGPPEETGDGA